LQGRAQNLRRREREEEGKKREMVINAKPEALLVHTLTIV
jgi:hypothetical protein